MSSLQDRLIIWTNYLRLNSCMLWAENLVLPFEQNTCQYWKGGKTIDHNLNLMALTYFSNSSMYWSGRGSYLCPSDLRPLMLTCLTHGLMPWLSLSSLAALSLEPRIWPTCRSEKPSCLALSSRPTGTAPLCEKTISNDCYTDVRPTIQTPTLYGMM